MKRLTLVLALCLTATMAQAGNSLIVPNQSVAVAKSPLTVRPSGEWNKLAARPGRSSETWTIDGDTLNCLTFYGGIEDGRTLFREVDKRGKPLPHFSSTMLLTDVPGLVENSYRIALGTSLFQVGKIEPVTLAGQRAVHFAYDFVSQGDDLHRKGEGYAAIAHGKLFMITFEAPALYYFDAGIETARQVVSSALLDSK